MVQDIEYTIDRDLLIKDIKGDWDDFAQANQSEMLVQNCVNRNLLDFISDDPLRDIYHKMIIYSFETQKELIFSFRCDSHEVMRFMEMKICPNQDMAIISTRMIKQVPRRQVLRREILYMGITKGINMCSCCNKVLPPSTLRWIEIDDAIEQGLITDMLDVVFKTCEECSDNLSNLLLSPKQERPSR